MDATLPVNNFSAGQLGRSLFFRYELPAHKKGVARCFNFLPLLQGPAKFRPGSLFIKRTRGNKVPFFLPFVFDAEQSYILEFTYSELSFFDSDGAFLEDAQAITGVTSANPGVFTCAGHGLSDGDEVYISGIVGMEDINGQFYTVDNADTNTFTLRNIFEEELDTSDLTYSSGGAVARVYAIDTVYTDDDLQNLQIAQEADVTYIVDGYHEPLKLSRLGLTNWTLSAYTRTNDPFLTASISGITQADPGVITTSAAHGLTNGEIIHLRSIGGMTELNGNSYLVAVLSDTTLSLTDIDGNDIDTTGYTAYTTGGSIFAADDQPAAVGLYGGRLFFGGTARNPDGLFGSRGPEDTGAKRYDDFTVGTDASHGVRFFISSSDRTLERVNWFAGSSQFLGIGAATDVYKATGASGDGSAITGTSIDIKPTGSLGSASVLPARLGPSIFYVQRGRQVLNSFEYDLYNDGYTSIDQSILNPDISRGGLKQLAFQQGTPSYIWAIDDNGALLSLTYKSSEDISAWAKHKIAGESPKVLTICQEPLPDAQDRLWLCAERMVNGQTMRYVEQMAIDNYMPDRFDYYTGDKETDDRVWRSLMVEAQSTLVRTDSSISYVNAPAANITLSAVTGVSVTVTATASVFEAGDVGKRIACKYITGSETGMGVITGYTSDTEVTIEIFEDFSSLYFLYDDWYLSFDNIGGLLHLEGQEVVCLGDGGEAVSATVSGGRVQLSEDFFRVVIGLGYTGVLESLPIEVTTFYGQSATKVLTINRLGIAFSDSLSFKYGRDRYNLSELNLRNSADAAWRPPILSGGQVQRPAKCGHGSGLSYVIVAESPKPCTIDGVVFYTSVGQEDQ
ncbi:MAG: hypothetical protein EOL91_04190 [Actinobacteria bacterium]|nr:hypothetical protein [Actinomycetota bacterium]